MAMHLVASRLRAHLGQNLEYQRETKETHKPLIGTAENFGRRKQVQACTQRHRRASLGQWQGQKHKGGEGLGLVSTCVACQRRFKLALNVEH